MAGDAAIGPYRDMGIRVIYARMSYDYAPPDFLQMAQAAQAREPGVRHPAADFETGSAAPASIDRLISRHHRSAGGRMQVWPSPGVAILCSKEGLLGAWPTVTGGGWLLLVGLAAGAATAIFVASMRRLSPTGASIASTAEPISTALLGAAVLGPL